MYLCKSVKQKSQNILIPERTFPMKKSHYFKNSHQSYGATVLVGGEYVWFDLHNFNLRCPACHRTVELEIESRKNNTHQTLTTKYIHASIINIY